MDGGRVTALRHWNSPVEMILTRLEGAETIDAMEDDGSIYD
jgi:hypothetical protein